ncbi:MAG: hypothetical protein EON58_04610 [Alphaproteobacteria bacterium]|nr:MAG: hypothetical protein EON58_04610 [Alphaproteobacteria bacterium]
MKKTVVPKDTPANWDAEALFAKSVRYAEKMVEADSDTWEHAFWSALSLELLARAALSNISPALLAETDKTWSSLFHALGFDPVEERFAPRSIAITEALRRLSSILPDFTKEHESFCVQHTGKRNAELHSGDTAFDGVPASSWNAKFYDASLALLRSMGLELEDYVGPDHAEYASKLIEAAADQSAKAVKGDVDAHKRVWLAKGEEERATLLSGAKAWALRQSGHRVDCPSCGSPALLNGEPIDSPKQKLEDGEITETQEYLPSQFECVACGLKISGLSKLAAIGIADRYKKTQRYDAAEYYAPEDDFSGYEDDNNER